MGVLFAAVRSEPGYWRLTQDDKETTPEGDLDNCVNSALSRFTAQTPPHANPPPPRTANCILPSAKKATNLISVC